jgi:predicted nucleotide-binding protein (sugar kinase/HSP70/actin superfamily)
VTYSGLVDQVVEAFDRLPLLDVPRKPRVGIVGEVMVRLHPDANNDLVHLVEAEHCEVTLPGLVDYFLVNFLNAGWNARNLGKGRRLRFVKAVLGRVLERYRAPVVRALARTDGKFMPPVPVRAMADRASAMVSLGNQAGEGWLLLAEMLELIHHDVPNIICVQPFACLPNHVTGKGMFRRVQREHPHANVVAIDYDPGASAVNQINRIRLMISTAHLRHADQGRETARHRRIDCR